MFTTLKSLSLYSFIHEALGEGRYLSSDDSQWGQNGFLWKWHLSCTFLYLWASVSLCWVWYTGPVLGVGMSCPDQPLCGVLSVSRGRSAHSRKESTDYEGGFSGPHHFLALWPWASWLTSLHASTVTSIINGSSLMVAALHCLRFK